MWQMPHRNASLQDDRDFRLATVFPEPQESPPEKKGSQIHSAEFAQLRGKQTD